MGWTIVIGADDAGYAYKQVLARSLRPHPRVDQVIDVGVTADDTTPYPHVAGDAAGWSPPVRVDRALLVCGTGLGVAIAANKVRGVRAVTAHDSYSVERSVLSNNAQVLTMGARVIGLELAKKLVDEWLVHTFDPASASAAKVALIEQIEAEEKR